MELAGRLRALHPSPPTSPPACSEPPRRGRVAVRYTMLGGGEARSLAEHLHAGMQPAARCTPHPTPATPPPAAARAGLTNQLNAHINALTLAHAMGADALLMPHAFSRPHLNHTRETAGWRAEPLSTLLDVPAMREAWAQRGLRLIEQVRGMCRVPGAARAACEGGGWARAGALGSTRDRRERPDQPCACCVAPRPPPCAGRQLGRAGQLAALRQRHPGPLTRAQAGQRAG